MNLFLYNIVVAAYHVFVYVVSRAGRQVDSLLFSSIELETDVFGFQLPIPAYLVKPYGKCRYAATTILIRKVHILTRDFS